MKALSLFTFLLILVCAPAQAQDKNIRMALMNPVKQENGTYALSVYFDLDDGWHTYYKEPGDAGLPPRFDWSSSVNAQGFEITQWPEPLHIDEAGFTVNGYKDEFSLPIVFSIPDQASPSHVTLSAQVMVCHEICIPEKLEATLAIQP